MLWHCTGTKLGKLRYVSTDKPNTQRDDERTLAVGGHVAGDGVGARVFGARHARRQVVAALLVRVRRAVLARRWRGVHGVSGVDRKLAAITQTCAATIAKFRRHVSVLMRKLSNSCYKII